MSKRKCPVCGESGFIPAEDIALDMEGYVIMVKGDRCNKCGKEFPYEHETQKAIEVARTF